jgi:hypothetical protein
MPYLKKTSNQPRQSPANQHDEIIQIAQKHRLTEQQVRDLIARVGNDREKLERAAGEVSGRS